MGECLRNNGATNMKLQKNSFHNEFVKLKGPKPSLYRNVADFDLNSVTLRHSVFGNRATTIRPGRGVLP